MGGLAVFLLFGTSCSGSEASASDTPKEEEAESATDRPNILFVLTDDLDYASAQKMPQIRSRVAALSWATQRARVYPQPW